PPQQVQQPQVQQVQQQQQDPHQPRPSYNASPVSHSPSTGFTSSAPLHLCMALSESRGESSVGSVPADLGLHGLALFNQPTVRSAVAEDGTEEWVSDNGATHHTTGSSEHMYDVHPPPP
ncbi:unnamed protein product, partial [Pylaiella littoralis]